MFEYVPHRVMTPRGSNHSRLFLAHNFLFFMVHGASTRKKYKGTGVVNFDICVDRIVKERGSSVQCSIYSRTFQGLNNLNLFKNSVCTNMKFYHSCYLYFSRALAPPPMIFFFAKNIQSMLWSSRNSCITLRCTRTSRGKRSACTKTHEKIL